MVIAARTNDPQYTLNARVKHSRLSDSELITFSRFSEDGLTEECFIVPIPDLERNSVSVYVKVKKYDSPPPQFLASTVQTTILGMNFREGKRYLARDQQPQHDDAPSGQTPQDKADARDEG